MAVLRLTRLILTQCGRWQFPKTRKTNRRLVGAVLAEQHDDRGKRRGYSMGERTLSRCLHFSAAVGGRGVFGLWFVRYAKASRHPARRARQARVRQAASTIGPLRPAKPRPLWDRLFRFPEGTTRPRRHRGLPMPGASRRRSAIYAGCPTPILTRPVPPGGQRNRGWLDGGRTR